MSPAISVKKDVAAIKPSATVVAPYPTTVHPEGIQVGEKQDIGPR